MAVIVPVVGSRLFFFMLMLNLNVNALSGQISIIPKPELGGFWGDSLTKPQFWGDYLLMCYF